MTFENFHIPLSLKALTRQCLGTFISRDLDLCKIFQFIMYRLMIHVTLCTPHDSNSKYTLNTLTFSFLGNDILKNSRTCSCLTLASIQVTLWIVFWWKKDIVDGKLKFCVKLKEVKTISIYIYNLPRPCFSSYPGIKITKEDDLVCIWKVYDKSMILIEIYDRFFAAVKSESINRKHSHQTVT